MSDEGQQGRAGYDMAYECANMEYESTCYIDNYTMTWQQQEYGKLCAGDAACEDLYTQRYISERWRNNEEWYTHTCLPLLLAREH